MDEIIVSLPVNNDLPVTLRPKSKKKKSSRQPQKKLRYKFPAAPNTADIARNTLKQLGEARATQGVGNYAKTVDQPAPSRGQISKLSKSACSSSFQPCIKFQPLTHAVPTSLLTGTSIADSHAQVEVREIEDFFSEEC